MQRGAQDNTGGVILQVLGYCVKEYPTMGDRKLGKCYEQGRYLLILVTV